MNEDYAKLWMLDPEVTFLNHGSFGACPRVVLGAQQSWRERLERQPVQFLMRDVEGALDIARGQLADFLGAKSSDLAFVANATAGVNAVLRSSAFEAGDEILVTSHGYNACTNAARFVAQRAAGRVVTAEIPFPIEEEDQVIQRVMADVTARTKLAVIDHVTSATALILPIKKIVDALQARGIDVLVDGAHAPGMVKVDLQELGAAYYTGNCHKWLCGPKSAGFLHVREDKQKDIRPTVISHGMNSYRGDRSRFLLEFDWTGTSDPTAILAIPKAIEFLSGLMDGGINELMRANQAMALKGRQLLCEAMGVKPGCPDEMIGSMATISVDDEKAGEPFPVTRSPTLNPIEPLQNALLENDAIEVPVMNIGGPPKRQIRISAQVYNSEQDYQDLADALIKLLQG